MSALLSAVAATLALAAAPPERLVVVAPAEWHAALAPYVAARAAELEVELVALEDALAAGAGSDAPERLKRWLFAAWRERGARYALLVGDADTLPVRFMVLDRRTAAACDTAFYPSDLYYADLAREDGAFDDWNAARDGHHARYFGEVRGETHKDGPIDLDRVSYAPELALGRWPVSDAAELAAVVTKTLAHRPAAAPRVLAVHADGWVDARARLGRGLDALASAGFDVERQLYGARAGVPGPASVKDALLAGAALALHVGHGTNEGWHGCLGPAERDALSAAPPAVYLSVGCSTAHWCCEPPYQAYLDEGGLPHRGTNAGEVFAAPPPPPAALQPGRLDGTGLAERLLLAPRGGAVLYIGCATGAQPCALSLLDGFVAELADAPALRVGEAWRRALARYVEVERLRELVPTDSWYPPSVFFQGMKFALLGDPTLRVAAPAEPAPAGPR